MSSAGRLGTRGVPRPEREKQIRAAAVVEFARAGFAGASMIEIARRADVSKPLVYQYFGSKDALYLACLHDVAGALLERLEDAERAVDLSVASRIHPLRAVFTALEPQRDAWRLLFDATAPDEGPIAEAAHRYRHGTTAIAASGSRRFLAARGIRSSLDASALTAVWMSLLSSLVEWWLEHPRETAEQMTARCERLLGAVLTPPATDG